MDKTQLQARELGQVSGGDLIDGALYRCPQCQLTYNKDDPYPDGYLLKAEKLGCGSWSRSYKCPSCGYEWKTNS